MKKAKKPRPKNLKHLAIASKKSAKQGLIKPCLTLKGDTTLTIYIEGLKPVGRKNKKRWRKIKRGITWVMKVILIALITVLVQFIAQKVLPSSQDLPQEHINRTLRPDRSSTILRLASQMYWFELSSRGKTALRNGIGTDFFSMFNYTIESNDHVRII